jgi:hypothetical protein
MTVPDGSKTVIPGRDACLDAARRIDLERRQTCSPAIWIRPCHGTDRGRSSQARDEPARHGIPKLPGIDLLESSSFILHRGSREPKAMTRSASLEIRQCA